MCRHGEDRLQVVVFGVFMMGLDILANADLWSALKTVDHRTSLPMEADAVLNCHALIPLLSSGEDLGKVPILHPCVFGQPWRVIGYNDERKQRPL